MKRPLFKAAKLLIKNHILYIFHDFNNQLQCHKVAANREHLYCACMCTLLQARADININTRDGYNVFYPSLMSSSVRCIRIVLKAGVEVNKKDLFLQQNALENYTGNSDDVQRDVVDLAMAAGEEIHGATVKKTTDQNSVITVDIPDYLKSKEIDMKLNLIGRPVIRKHLTDVKPPLNLFCKVPMLPLPAALRDYLLFVLTEDGEDEEMKDNEKKHGVYR